MILKQFLHPWISHASYLVGDAVSGIAAVVDPVRDVDPYLEAAYALHLQIRQVFLTRLHSDFETGHLELRDRALAEIYLGAWARPDYPFVPLKSHDVLEFGATRLEVLETSGRSRESIMIALYDLRTSDRDPAALLTGDTLWDGDLGWPSPRASDGLSRAEMAEQLFDSLRIDVLSRPDDTRIYPGHVPSLDGAGERRTSLGEQRRVNYGLRMGRKAEFVRLACAERDDNWKYLTAESALNRSERPGESTTRVVGLKPYAPDELLKENVKVVDVRAPADFAGAHWAGSLNLPLGPKLAVSAASLLEGHAPIVVVAEPGQEEAAVVRLSHLGRVAGYLRGGMNATEHHVRLLARTPRWTATALAAALAGPRPPTVLDVRPSLTASKEIFRGALRRPIETLPYLVKSLPDGDLVLACEQDGTSTAAASYLEAAGRRGVSTLIGGLHAWSLTSAAPAGARPAGARAGPRGSRKAGPSRT